MTGGFLKFIEAEYGDVFHEWNTADARRFFEASGISKRNWRIYMRSVGLAVRRESQVVMHATGYFISKFTFGDGLYVFGKELTHDKSSWQKG